MVFSVVLGLYFMEPEITPSGVKGDFRFNQSDESVTEFPAEVEVRALLEGQLMAKRHHAQSLGYQITPSSRVLATGGAAVNHRIRQVSKHCGNNS